MSKETKRTGSIMIKANNNVDFIELRPQHLLCILCMNGGAYLPIMEKHNLKEKLEKIKSNPDIHIRLVTGFDEIGVPTDIFYELTPQERKRDLSILQKLGLVPNSIRTARILIQRINENITNLHEICVTNCMPTDTWRDCSLASAGYFDEGKKDIISTRDSNEIIKAKGDSANVVNETEQLFVRAHHLLCILCSIGANTDKPKIQNNTYEVWKKIIDNPDIPVTIVEGCSQCMICKPCKNYRADRSICVSLSGLRDRLKDLTVFQKLGLNPGDTIPAKVLYKMIAEKIPDTFGICQYERETSPEWRNCMSLGVYEKGKNKIMELL
ncbi:MAG TPA: hypothetical protein PK733_06815 [Clostridiales bacterium]|nr:hypothetical protein [Clostridiales bacterium]